MELQCTIEPSGDRIVVAPTGDVDLQSAPALRQVLQDAVARDDTRRIEIDLSKVTFLDSAGIGVIVAAHRAASDKGATLLLREPGPVVRMVLEVTNLYSLLVEGAEAETPQGRSGAVPKTAHRGAASQADGPPRRSERS
jgi:anti-anti-sigma factor